MMLKAKVAAHEGSPAMQNVKLFNNGLPTYPGPAWQRRYDATRAALDSQMRLGEYLRAIAALGAQTEAAGKFICAPKQMSTQWRESRQRILLIPGSFNPLTWAHVALAFYSQLAMNRTGGEQPIDYFLWSGA